MQSRKKWKRRYYKLRKKEREDAEFINKVFPDKRLKEMIEESREIGRKAAKYDVLIEKLEEEILYKDIKIEATKTEKILYRNEIKAVINSALRLVNLYRKEVLSFVKGEKK